VVGAGTDGVAGATFGAAGVVDLFAFVGVVALLPFAGTPNGVGAIAGATNTDVAVPVTALPVTGITCPTGNAFTSTKAAADSA